MIILILVATLQPHLLVLWALWFVDYLRHLIIVIKFNCKRFVFLFRQK